MPKPSATGQFTNGPNLVADGQTSEIPSTTSGPGQTETNHGKQKRGCFVSEMIWQKPLCDRLRGKINYVLTSQQHESRQGWPILSVRNAIICTISIRMDLSRFSLALTCLMIEEIPAHLLQPRVLTRCQNPFRSAKTAQCRNQPQLLCAVHLQEGSG